MGGEFGGAGFIIGTEDSVAFETVRERGSSEWSDSGERSAQRRVAKRFRVLPSPRLRSARPFRLPAASARSLSRFSSRSRISFSRWFRAAAPRIFLWLPGTNFMALSASSSESGFGSKVSLSEGGEEPFDAVRCLLGSSFRLFMRGFALVALLKIDG